MAEPRIHLRACNLCEAMCGVRIEVEGERIPSIRGDDDDPFSQGYICPKATALEDLHDDPDRLQPPLRRAGDALDGASAGTRRSTRSPRRLAEVQRAHGRDAVAVYLGNPTVHNLGAADFGPCSCRARSARTNRYSATSVDQLPHMLAALADVRPPAADARSPTSIAPSSSSCSAPTRSPRTAA